jgi:hypothetical protein
VKALLWIGIKGSGFLALWFLFSYSLSRSELYVGAASALLSVVAFEVSLRAEPLCFRPRVRWLKLIFKLPGPVVHDLVLMGRVLIDKAAGKRIHSRFRVTPFPSEVDTPYECARRALAVGLATVPPNSVVVGINRKKGALLYHELMSAPVPETIRALEENR